MSTQSQTPDEDLSTIDLAYLLQGHTSALQSILLPLSLGASSVTGAGFVEEVPTPSGSYKEVVTDRGEALRQACAAIAELHADAMWELEGSASRPKWFVDAQRKMAVIASALDGLAGLGPNREPWRALLGIRLNLLELEQLADRVLDASDEVAAQSCSWRLRTPAPTPIPDEMSAKPS